MNGCMTGATFAIAVALLCSSAAAEQHSVRELKFHQFICSLRDALRVKLVLVAESDRQDVPDIES